MRVCADIERLDIREFPSAACPPVGDANDCLKVGEDKWPVPGQQPGNGLRPRAIAARGELAEVHGKGGRWMAECRRDRAPRSLAKAEYLLLGKRLTGRRLTGKRPIRNRVSGSGARIADTDAKPAMVRDHEEPSQVPVWCLIEQAAVRAVHQQQ